MCFSAFFKHVYRWPLDMLYGGFSQFGIYFSSFCSVWFVSKCFHRNKAANSKQSRGCKYELVSERHSARNNVKNKGLVAICLLTYFVLLALLLNRTYVREKKNSPPLKKMCIYLKDW